MTAGILQVGNIISNDGYIQDALTYFAKLWAIQIEGYTTNNIIARVYANYCVHELNTTDYLSGHFTATVKYVDSEVSIVNSTKRDEEGTSNAAVIFEVVNFSTINLGLRLQAEVFNNPFVCGGFFEIYAVSYE